MTQKIRLQILALCILGVILFTAFVLIITLMYGSIMIEVARTLEVTQFKPRVHTSFIDVDSNVFTYEREQKSSASLRPYVDLPRQCPPEFPDTAGIASWYDYGLPDFPMYSTYTDTAASREYPKGTWLLVSYQNENVVVRVNDYVENPDVIIDLSSHAFQQLTPLHIGVIPVEVKFLHAVNNYLESKSDIMEQDVCRYTLDEEK